MFIFCMIFLIYHYKMPTNTFTYTTFGNRIKAASCAIATLIVSTFGIGVAGCANSSESASSNDKIPMVTVSIDPLRYFAEAIGGDSIEVTTLLPQGTDPETFEPGTAVMRSLAQSKSLIQIGTLPFENALLRNVHANNPSLAIYSVNEGIEPIYGTHTHHHSEGHNHHADEADPHVWSSVKNAIIIANNTLKALIATAPQHADYYTLRHAQLTTQLDSIDKSYTRQLAGLPSRTFVAWHPSLSYFARDYDLTQIALNAENKETSPRRIHQLLEKANSQRPLAFIIPTDMSPNQFESTAEALSLHPTAISFMSSNWQLDMQTLVNALTGTSNKKQ